MTPKGYAPPIAKLITELSRFPGVGEKSAARMANFILRGDLEEARRLARAIIEVKERINFCHCCFNLADRELCAVCRDVKRDHTVVCVVEDPDSLLAIEECGSYRGVYHVLHGCLAPLDGVGPDELKLKEFCERLKENSFREVIIATNPTVQGEATAHMISDLLKSYAVTVTRIATGVPIGGDLKYSDRMTLVRSLEFRRGMDK
jgi:recombination protein RecR